MKRMVLILALAISTMAASTATADYVWRSYGRDFGNSTAGARTYSYTYLYNTPFPTSSSASQETYQTFSASANLFGFSKQIAQVYADSYTGSNGYSSNSLDVSFNGSRIVSGLGPTRYTWARSYTGWIVSPGIVRYTVLSVWGASVEIDLCLDASVTFNGSFDLVADPAGTASLAATAQAYGTLNTGASVTILWGAAEGGIELRATLLNTKLTAALMANRYGFLASAYLDIVGARLQVRLWGKLLWGAASGDVVIVDHTWYSTRITILQWI